MTRQHSATFRDLVDCAMFAVPADMPPAKKIETAVELAVAFDRKIAPAARAIAFHRFWRAYAEWNRTR